MRSLLYVHDLPFHIYQDFFYSASFTDEYFDRFLSAGFEEINVLSRTLESESPPHGCNRLSGQSVVLSGIIGNSYKNLFKPSVLFKIASLIKSSSLVVLSTPSVNGFFVSLLCLLYGRKFVCEVAGDYTAFKTKRFGRVVTYLLKYYMPLVVRKAVGATYVTHDLFFKYPNSNAIVGSNVNIHRVSPRLNYSLRKPSKVSIGFVGGLVERKGIRTIIHAASILKKCDPSTKYEFNVIGGHADKDWDVLCVELDVSDVCIFHGMKTRSEIDELLESFDIYVQPSFSEGVPRATIEAMSHGLPIIATTLPGFYEILPADVLIEPGNECNLAARIRTYSGNEALRNDLGCKNLERSTDFLFSIMHSSRVSFYNNIFNNIRG